VFGEARFSAEELAAVSWQQAWQMIARRIFEVLGRHRDVASLLNEQVATGPNAMALRERCISVMLGNRFPPPAPMPRCPLRARVRDPVQRSGCGTA